MRRRHGSSSKRQLALSRRAVLLLRDLNEAWWQNAECSNLCHPVPSKCGMMKRQLLRVEKFAKKVKSLPRCFETPGPLGGEGIGLIARCWWRCTREARLDFLKFPNWADSSGTFTFRLRRNVGVLFAAQRGGHANVPRRFHGIVSLGTVPVRKGDWM